MIKLNGLELSKHHIFMNYNILNDTNIRNAILENKILFDKEIEDVQFQPNTLDVRIGTVKYFDPSEMAKKTGGVLVLGKNYEPTKIFEDNNNQHIDIMPGCNAQIYLHEQIKTEFMMGVELRSGHGKYGLISTSPIIFSDENGQFVHVTNSNPNSKHLMCFLLCSDDCY